MSHILIVATLALFPFSSQSLSVGHALHIFASSLAAYLAPSVYSASLAWPGAPEGGWGGDRCCRLFTHNTKRALFLPPLRGSSRIKEWSTGCKICGWVNTLQDILGEYLLRHVGDYLEVFFGIEYSLRY